MNDLMTVYTACVLVLFLKMFAISCYQGFFRFSTGAGIVGCIADPMWELACLR